MLTSNASELSRPRLTDGPLFLRNVSGSDTHLVTVFASTCFKVSIMGVSDEESTRFNHRPNNFNFYPIITLEDLRILGSLTQTPS